MKIIPTSNRTADVDDIILRELKTVRLVFRPMLIDNPKSTSASIRGRFIYQKKSKTADWEDIKTESLSTLKANEFVTLEIKSGELLKFFNEIAALYKLHRKEGIPWLPTEYVRLDSHIEGVLKATETELNAFLQENKSSGIEIVSRLFKWISGLDDVSSIIQSIENIDSGKLQRIGSLVGISALESCYKQWEENQLNSDELFWQNLLESNAYVLSQMFAQPFIIMKGNAYLGGKSIDNIGGSIADFLVKNSVTNNVVIIEIKTPATNLLGSEYRPGVYPISKELSGSISQICKYQDDLLNEYYELSRNASTEFTAFDPPCIVIAGNVQHELSELPKLRSFELLRSQLSKIQIVTYDEMFEKVKLLLDTIKGVGQQ